MTCTPYLGCCSEYCLFIYVLSLGAVKRRWRRIKSGGARCTTSVADICRVKVHFLWVLFSVFIPPFTCGTVVFVYLNLKVSIELYDIYCKGGRSLFSYHSDIIIILLNNVILCLYRDHA